MYKTTKYPSEDAKVGIVSDAQFYGSLYYQIATAPDGTMIYNEVRTWIYVLRVEKLVIMPVTANYMSAACGAIFPLPQLKAVECSGCSQFEHNFCKNVNLPTSVPPHDLFGGMLDQFRASFGEAFRHYFPHMWYLTPVTRPIDGVYWREFVDAAKVRFNCNKCGNCWTSMKGRVTFYALKEDQRGIVLFRLYGQQCQECKTGFETPMWYPEEVRKVLSNIANKIGEWFYGQEPLPIKWVRRQGRPRNKHNPAQCQACHENVCTSDKDFNSGKQVAKRPVKVACEKPR